MQLTKIKAQNLTAPRFRKYNLLNDQGIVQVFILTNIFLKKKSSLNHLRDHSSIRSAKKWVVGVRKWQFLLIYSTIYADVGGWVGLKKPKTC